MGNKKKILFNKTILLTLPVITTASILSGPISVSAQEKDLTDNTVSTERSSSVFENNDDYENVYNEDTVPSRGTNLTTSSVEPDYDNNSTSETDIDDTIKESITEERNTEQSVEPTDTSEETGLNDKENYYPAKDTSKQTSSDDETSDNANEKEQEEDKDLKDGWNTVDGKKIYIKDKKPYTGWIKENNKKVYVKNGEYYTGWVQEGTKNYYTKNGVPYTGWHRMGKNEKQTTEHWSYFGSDGVIRTGWQQMGTSKNPDKNNKVHWSYFGDNGWLRTGWQKIGKGTSNPDKNNAAHWSYFGDNGWLRTGWQQMGTSNNPDKNNKIHWSYFGDNGWLRTGWQQMGKGTSNPDKNNAAHWSYFGDNGWLRTGWQQMGKGTSNPDKNNAAHWSYFGDNGWLRTGWQQMGKGTSNPDKNNAAHWSYFGDNGWLRTGWLYMGKGTSDPDQNSTPHWSYFGSDGWLITGVKKIAGMTCTFNEYGWLRRFETLTPHYNQYAYGYPTGCAGTSLFMALKYKGKLKNWTLPQFMATMPYTNTGNPNLGFVGNPTIFKLSAANRGIYPAALAKWGAKYGNVSDISGCTFSYMLNEVRLGNPVVALATYNLSNYAITQYSWGKYRNENHHFFVLVGYNYDTDKYKVMDALISSGDGSKWVSGSAFRNVWNGIKGAVVVR